MLVQKLAQQDSLTFFLNYLHLFLLVWGRLLGVFIFAPLFSSEYFLMRFRILLAFFVALATIPWFSEYVRATYPLLLEGELGGLNYFLLVLKEFGVGAVIGFFMGLIFAAFQLSAQFFSLQIGLGIGEVFDPASGENRSLWGYFFYLVAALVFLRLKGFHLVIRLIVESYEKVPVLAYLEKSEPLFRAAVHHFTVMFLLALKLAMPIVATATLLILGLGVVGKMVPQANIFLIGLPLQLAVGLLFILITLPFIIMFFESFIGGNLREVALLLHQLKT